MYLNEQAVEDPGWVAYLFITGHPDQVVESYLAQAQREGYEVAALPGGEPFPEEGEPVPPTDFVRCGAVSDSGYRCAAAASDGDGRCLTVDLVRGRRSSHLTLRLLLNDAGGLCNGVAGVATDPDRPVPPVPERWPALPDPGDALGERWGVLAQVRVEEGSAVVAAPVAGDRDACGNPAVLTVDGDPEQVLEQYVDQFRALDTIEPETISEDYSAGARTLRSRTVLEPGDARSFSAALFTNGSDGWWLHLAGCPG